MRAYLAIGLVSAIGAFLLGRLLVGHRPEAGPQPAVLTERTLDPATWGRRFPAQFEAWRHVGPETSLGHARSLEDRDESKPDADLLWRRIFAGRSKLRPVPAACLYCHASLGHEPPAASYYESRRTLDRPVGCIDCHDPQTVWLRVTRPLPPREAPGGLRTLVCAQCHSQYSFSRDGRQIVYPWSRGLTVEQIEAWYDESGHRDWAHAETGAAVVEARHPQFELYSQGEHARAGVSCADCHMPYTRQGAARITDHRAHRASSNVEHACLPCHPGTAAEMKARIQEVQRRNALLVERAKTALVALLDAVRRAAAAGVPAASLEPSRRLQRKAQWRLDFATADHSSGFHAPQESARILAESLDFARQGELAAARATIVSAPKR